MPDLNDGESVEMQGSASRPYVLKNVGGLLQRSGLAQSVARHRAQDMQAPLSPPGRRRRDGAARWRSADQAFGTQRRPIGTRTAACRELGWR